MKTCTVIAIHDNGEQGACFRNAITAHWITLCVQLNDKILKVMSLLRTSRTYLESWRASHTLAFGKGRAVLMWSMLSMLPEDLKDMITYERFKLHPPRD